MPPKTEEAPATPATSQPAGQNYTGQWSAAIDPNLQAQSSTTSSYYSQYAQHYPQAAYSYYAQSQGGAGAQTASAAAGTTGAAKLPTTAYSGGSSAPAAGSSNAMDTADIATLNDALGSAGVDLRAEEESLQRTQDSHSTYRSYEDRSRKQPPKPAFDTRFLGPTMRTIGGSHKITRIPEESVNYLALSLRARLQDLVTAMIAAAHHRTDAQFDRPVSRYADGEPMWGILVKQDVAKQLAALEKVEREEEMRVRKERKERAELTAAHAAALAAQALGQTAGLLNGGGIGGAAGAGAGNGEDGEEGVGGPKKKRKKDGPGVTARNMSEDVRKKMSNAVASQAAGLGGKYSWMTAANASSAPAAKPKPAAAAAASAATAATGAAAAATKTEPGTPAAGGAAGGTAGSGWARPYVSTKKTTTTNMTPEKTPAEEDTRTTVTLRDAMFVIEKERGHGGGRGAARGWV